MELIEILKLNNIEDIFKEAKRNNIDKDLIIKNEEFKKIVYNKFKNEGISYNVMRTLVSEIGEKSCLDNLDIDKIMQGGSGNEVFFTTLLENGNSSLIDKVIDDEKYMKYFFSNIHKNYSALSFCDSRKVMELVDKVNSIDKYIPNIKELAIGLNDEDKEKILQGEYKEEIVLSTIDNASDKIVQDYINNNAKALYMYKKIGVLKLADRGISFPSDIIKQKDFFEQIKDTDIINFRRNINWVNRKSYSSSLNNKIKKYEEDILKDFNPETEMFNIYNLDNIDKLEESLSKEDSYLVDYDAKKNISNYLSAKKNLDDRKKYFQQGIREKLNLNINIDQINEIDIDDITDDDKVKEVLDRIKQEINSQNKMFLNIKEDVISNLKNISNVKFGDMLIDFKFEDTKNNVSINTNEMTRYNSTLKDKVLNKEKEELYTKVKNIDALTGKQKYELYMNIENEDMVSELYKDFSALKKKSYEEIKKSLYKTENGVENLSLEDSNLNDMEVHRLKGNPFYMLVRALNSPIHEETMNAQSCYSLISSSNTNIINHNSSEYIYGYDDIDIDMIENVFESDSYTFSSGNDITNRPNRIMTKEEIVESSEIYSEINIKNKENDKKTGRKYKEMMPSYVVSMDNPTKEQIEESKRLGVPLVVIEREIYKTKTRAPIEELKYDPEIN